MRIAASWSNIGFDRIQVRGAMLAAGYCKLPWNLSSNIKRHWGTTLHGLGSRSVEDQGEEPLRVLDTTRPIQVVADGGEDGVGRIAVSALEVAAPKMTVVLHMADDGFNGGSAS